jgi:hypothetical protein
MSGHRRLRKGLRSTLKALRIAAAKKKVCRLYIANPNALPPPFVKLSSFLKRHENKSCVTEFSGESRATKATR